MPVKEISNLKTAQTQETRSKILNASLKLFNQHGSNNITTHDIANEADVSPGNLYYHFKNKQAIIRNLFYQIEIFSIKSWWSKSPANREVRFTDFMQFYFESISKYQFFFREFSYLLTQDPILLKEWRRTYSELFSVMKEALEGWIKQGLIKPFKTEKDANIFIDTIWILSAFSQIHLDSKSTSEQVRFPDGVHQILARFLYPYHTPKGQRVIDLYL